MTNHPAAWAGFKEESNHTFQGVRHACPANPAEARVHPETPSPAARPALTCTAGTLWITSDALAGLGPDSDVVLESGQSFVTPQAATYFVGAPRGCGVLSLLSPTALAASPLETAC
jgi:hypothetical protein